MYNGPSMSTKITLVGAALTLSLSITLTTACSDKTGPAPSPTSSAASAEVKASAKPSSPAPSAATAAPSGSAEPAKTFACGAKENPCPMQKWMKTVMMSAAKEGADPKKLAEAMEYVAARPPPGYGEWVAISKEAIAKAKSGDADGAKETCKKCHDLYKDSYKSTMRDRPF